MNPRRTPPPRGLTPKYIESLNPDAAAVFEVPDRAAPGLRLRVLRNHKKVFRWQVRSLRRVGTLGRWALYPAPGHVTLQEARQWLALLKAARAAGPDQLDAVERELHTHTGTRREEKGMETQPPRDSVRRVAEDFFRIRIKDVRKSHQEVLRVLNHDIIPSLGADTDIKAVTPRLCGSVIEAALARGAPAAAGRALDIMKQFLRWATATGRIDRNPADLMTRDTYGLEKSHRERCLSDEEIVLFWSTMAGDRSSHKSALALQLILLTGVRVNEMARAERCCVDFGTSTWTVPVHHQKKSRKQEKSAKDFVIPLPPLALKAMRELSAVGGASRFVVPGDGPEQHCTGPGLRTYLQRRFGSPGREGRFSLPSGPITVHDLRRTMRTKLGELGVAPHIAERCLNHTRLDAYDKGDYLAQRREALEAWANHIEQLVAAAAAKRAA